MKLAILAGALMALGVAGILVATLLRVNEHYTVERTDYGIILDAGSTSTKAYIYQWRHKTETFIPFVSLAKSDSDVPFTYSATPGMISLLPNYTHVGDYLEPILSWASSLIPKHSISSTPIFLQGTGGFRQLPELSCNALLTAARYKLQDSGFYFENSYASVLSGPDEAGFGFLAVNALYDRFASPGDSTPLETYGSLDMGGESSEVAYVDSSPPLNYSFAFTVNTSVYNLYAQSIDGLGINAARYALNYSLSLNTTGNIVQDPCVPYGYYENVTINTGGNLRSFLLMGQSNAEACQQQVQGLVRQLTANLPRPNVGDATFALADHYVKIKNFYKLKDNANLLELEAKTYSYCSLSYGDAMAHHKKDVDEVQNFCFMGFYAATLLEDYYGFDPTMRHLLWREKVHNKSPLTWTIGSMLNQVSLLPPDTSNQIAVRHRRYYHKDTGVVLLFVSVLVTILGFVIFVLQYRRPSSEYVVIR